MLWAQLSIYVVSKSQCELFVGFFLQYKLMILLISGFSNSLPQVPLFTPIFVLGPLCSFFLSSFYRSHSRWLFSYLVMVAFLSSLPFVCLGQFLMQSRLWQYPSNFWQWFDNWRFLVMLYFFTQFDVAIYSIFTQCCNTCLFGQRGLSSNHIETVVRPSSRSYVDNFLVVGIRYPV